MKLPTLVIASFKRSCQSDMDDIAKFLIRYGPEDLVADGGLTEKLERLRITLWKRWCRMDTAWRNHNPTDGNVGMATLEGLGTIVKATRVAVDDVLHISGKALEMTREIASSQDKPPVVK